MPKNQNPEEKEKKRGKLKRIIGKKKIKSEAEKKIKLFLFNKLFCQRL